jgi:hypothetical protein
MPAAKRKLGTGPVVVGAKWGVSLGDGSMELYESEIDALRAHECALTEAAQEQELRTLKAYWAGELGAGVRAKAARFGSTRKELAPLPQRLYDLLIQGATQE